MIYLFKAGVIGSLLLSSLISCRKTEVISSTLWKPVEIDLRVRNNQDVSWREPEIKATFYHKSDTIMIKAFRYDTGIFRLRFTPTYTGLWQFEIKEASRLVRKGFVQVSCADPGNHGFLRRDKEHPYHFVMDDGTRFYMSGTTYYNMLLNAFAGDKWKTAIDSAMVFGINKMRIFAHSAKSSKTPYPYVSPFQQKNDSADYSRLNPEYWKSLDEIIQYSFEKGMTVDMIMLGYGAATYVTEDLDKQYIRYLLTRYAAYPNVIWCLTNEWNYIYRDHGRGKPFWNSIGEIIRKEDPYMEYGGQFRALSIHQQTRADFQFFNYEWPVHAIVQLVVRNGQGTVKDEWDDTDPEFKTATRFGDEWGNYSITYNLGHNMPVVNDEFGYMGEPLDRSEASSNDRSTWPRFTREKHRNVMWGIVLAGGYGSTGDKNTYDDGSPYFSANWHSDPPEYNDVKILTDFFRSGEIEYWKMKTSNELVLSGNRVYALAEAGRQYLYYSAAGNSFKTRIYDGGYKISKLNPVTGNSEEFGETRGGEVTINLDGNQDWAVLILNTGQ